MSDARETTPSFDELVELIEKNFKQYLRSTKIFDESHIEDGWQRYKALNNLYQDEIKWGSKELIGRSRECFEELIHKQWDWRSFYNGWIEGRGDMLSQINGWGPYKENNKTNNNENS